MRRSATTPLPIEPVHALRVSELPDHHSDPFDRLLIAQAQVLRIPVVTADKQIEAYDVDIVAA
jgi:PIN domain nuclease of toxin-antitoxin system